MAESESYVAKEHPTAEDWVMYNQGLFDVLRGEAPSAPVRYAAFSDVDAHAATEGITVDAYLEKLKKTVGPLGKATLELAYSEMDDATHIVIVPTTETQSL